MALVPNNIEKHFPEIQRECLVRDNCNIYLINQDNQTIPPKYYIYFTISSIQSKCFNIQMICYKRYHLYVCFYQWHSA